MKRRPGRGVQIRLIGQQADVEHAVAELEQHGAAFTPPRQGRRGEWLAYGAYVVQGDQDATNRHPNRDHDLGNAESR